MLLYIGVALWPLIVQWIYSNKPFAFNIKPMNRNMHIIIAMLPIFILLAFRSSLMGADTGTYMRNFVYMIDTPLKTAIDDSRMETGYLIFVKLLTYITHNPLVYQVICVTCMFVGLYDFSKHLDGEDAFLFLYFYCTLGLFFFMFTGTRQCLAMGICLFSYKYIRQKKYIGFILCVVLAFCFHKSAILVAVVLLIYKMKVNALNTGIYFILALICGRYLDVIQDWFNDKLEYNYEIEETNSGMIFLLVLVLLTIFSLIMIYNRDGNLNSNKYTVGLININFVSLFFWIMRLQTRVAERPSYYFLFFSCAFYATALNCIEDKKLRITYKIAVCGFAMLLFIYRLRTNFSTLIPYEFFGGL